MCGGVSFETIADQLATHDVTARGNGEMADEEKGEVEEEPLVSAEFGLGLDSRYMTYGVIDGKDPIVRANGYLTFADWLYIGGEMLFDTTKCGRKYSPYEWGNRAGKYTILDSIVGLAHDFDCGETLGALSVDFNYIYEYIHRYRDEDGAKCMDDTQYLNLELSLGDLWFEPALWIERDLMADDGTYVNLSIGHAFPLIDGEGEGADPVLAFRPSVGQGWGNTLRTHGYFNDSVDNGFSHGGLMDTAIKGELTWNISENVSLSGYVAYSDYLLDGNMRDAARAYNARWGHGCNHSWNFYGGIALGVSF